MNQVMLSCNWRMHLEKSEYNLVIIVCAVDYYMRYFNSSGVGFVGRLSPKLVYLEAPAG